MPDRVQAKAFELLNSIDNARSALRLHALRGEKGQTATEYVAITAVGLLLVLTVVWFVLQGALTTTINTMGNKLVNFLGT